MALKFRLPQMSLTMQEGTIIRWVAEEGSALKRNDVLLELETDKTTAELTSPCDGILLSRNCKEKEVVEVGSVVCVIDDGSVDADQPKSDNKAEAPKEEAKVVITVSAQTEGKKGKLISPLAARIAKEKGIDISGMSGTGPRGVIVKKDVLAAQERSAQAPSSDSFDMLSDMDKAYGPYKLIPFEGTRKSTADNMMRSKMNTATVTTFVDVDMGNVKRMREFVKVTYTTYVVKAAANAMRDYPELNCALIGDSIRMYEDVNINVAVAAGDRLVTPVVHQVDKKDIVSVNDDIAALAARAKNDELMLPDYNGGTFTVTNSGVFGSVFFTPIINYPQCAILGMGKTTDTPVVKDGQIVIAPMMKLCLTYDHRLVDGATAVKYLVKVKEGLENPSGLIK